MTCEQMRRCPIGGEGPDYVTVLGKSIPGRGNSKCKDPEVGACLAYMKKNKECSMVGAEGKRGGKPQEIAEKRTFDVGFGMSFMRLGERW